STPNFTGCSLKTKRPCPRNNPDLKCFSRVSRLLVQNVRKKLADYVLAGVKQQSKRAAFERIIRVAISRRHPRALDERPPVSPANFRNVERSATGVFVSQKRLAHRIPYTRLDGTLRHAMEPRIQMQRLIENQRNR